MRFVFARDKPAIRSRLKYLFAFQAYFLPSADVKDKHLKRHLELNGLMSIDSTGPTLIPASPKNPSI